MCVDSYECDAMRVVRLPLRGFNIKLYALHKCGTLVYREKSDKDNSNFMESYSRNLIVAMLHAHTQTTHIERIAF